MEEKDNNTPTFSDSPENPTSGGGGAEVGGGSGSGSGYFLSGKKRGRPRKYDAEGNLNPAYVASAAKKAAARVGSTPGGIGFTLTMPSEFKPKRGRGRGAATAAAATTTTAVPVANWQQLSPLGDLFANSGGVDFTPYVVTVQTGEDVAAKIHLFCQKGPRGICILSAIGAISNVTIRQPGSSGGLLTYEGRFEILSLNGSYTVTEAGGVTSKNGGLSISLAGPDGRVVGGGVAGWLTAASPTQVVIGSFVPSGYKQKRKYHRESTNVSAISAVPEAMAGANQNTQVGPNTEPGGHAMFAMTSQSPNEGDDSLGSGHHHNVGSSHNTPVWNDGSEQRLSDHRNYPDINVSVPGV